MIVLDANILVRAILGRRIYELLSLYEPRGVRFLAPATAFAEAEEHAPIQLKRRGKLLDKLQPTLDYLHDVVESIGPEVYGPFEERARLRLRGRDEDDWPVLASALAVGCDIWTEDTDFFGTGVAVWTTSRVEIFLKQQAESITRQDE